MISVPNPLLYIIMSACTFFAMACSLLVCVKRYADAQIRGVCHMFKEKVCLMSYKRTLSIVSGIHLWYS